MIMGQELHKIERMYDTVAEEYSETFFGEHEKKSKDQKKQRGQGYTFDERNKGVRATFLTGKQLSFQGI